MITVMLIPLLGMLGMLDERREVLSWAAQNRRDSLVINVIRARPYGGPTRTEIVGSFGGRSLRKGFDGPSDVRVEQLRGRTIFIIDNYVGTKDGCFW